MAARITLTATLAHCAVSVPQNIEWSINVLQTDSFVRVRDGVAAGGTAASEPPPNAALASLLPNTTASSPNLLLPPSLDAPLGTVAELWVWPQQIAATGVPGGGSAPPSDCVYTHTQPNAWTVMYLDVHATLLGATQIPTINAPSDVVLLPRAVVYVASQHAIVAYGGFMANGSQADAAAAGIDWVLCKVYHWDQCLVPSYSTYIFDVGSRTWTALDVSATGPESPAGPPGTAYDCCGGAVNCSIVPDGRAVFSVQLQYDAVGDTVWALSAEQCPFTGFVEFFSTPCAVVFRLSVPDWRWHVMSPPQVFDERYARKRPTGIGAWMVTSWVGESFNLWVYGGLTWSPLVASYVCWTASEAGWQIATECDPDVSLVPPWFLYDTLYARLPSGELVFSAGRLTAPNASDENALSQATWIFDPLSKALALSSMDVRPVEAAIQAGAVPPVMPATLASSRLHALSADPGSTQWTYIAWGGVMGNASMPYVRTYSVYGSCSHRYGGEDALGEYFTSQPLLLHVFRVRPLPSLSTWLWTEFASLAVLTAASMSVVLCCIACGDAHAVLTSIRTGRRARPFVVNSCVRTAEVPKAVVASQIWVLLKVSALVNVSAVVLTGAFATASFTLESDSFARWMLQAVIGVWLSLHLALHMWAARTAVVRAVQAVWCAQTAYHRCLAVGSTAAVVVASALHSTLVRTANPVDTARTRASEPPDTQNTPESHQATSAPGAVRGCGRRRLLVPAMSAALATGMSLIQMVVTWVRPQAEFAHLTLPSGFARIYVSVLGIAIAALSISAGTVMIAAMLLRYSWHRTGTTILHRIARVPLQSAREALLQAYLDSLDDAELWQRADATDEPTKSVNAETTQVTRPPVRTAWPSDGK